MTSVLTIQPHGIRGGPSLQHLEFIRGLRSHGIRCHAVIPPQHELKEVYQELSASVFELEGLEIVPRSLDPRRVAAHLADSASSARCLARHAKAIGAEVLHTFNEGLLAGPLAARLAGLPSAIHIIGMSIFRPPPFSLMYCQWLRFSGDAIVCCQRGICEILEGAFVPSDRLHVVYNCVDPEAVRAAAERDAPPAPGGTLRIGMLAGLDRRKGHLVLARAARRICRELPEARVFIIGTLEGDPAYLAELRAFIATAGLGDRLQLVGPVAHPAPWIRSLDVYCIPSLSEALSVAGIEAMCLERPIVASAVGGNLEAVADNETGLLFPVGDSAKLADCVIALARDAERRNELGRAALARARTRFGLQENASKLARLLQDLAR
jgi:glycosyltransferase involved in cell wall biosynthesis